MRNGRKSIGVNMWLISLLVCFRTNTALIHETYAVMAVYTVVIHCAGFNIAHLKWYGPSVQPHAQRPIWNACALEIVVI